MESSELGVTPGPCYPFQGGQPPTREALAKYLLDNREQICAIARRKLSTHARTIYDSEEILSSVLRRLDLLACRGLLHPRSEDELWAFIGTVARHHAINRTRLIENARSRLTAETSQLYERLVQRLNAMSTDDEAAVLVYRMMLWLRNEVDRHVLGLMLRGANHRAVGDLLGFSEDASRQRWLAIRRALEAAFAKGDLDE